MRLTPEDQARVTAAVTAAELRSDGEIVTVVADRSDSYNDVAAHAGVVAMLLVLTALAIWPGLAERLHALYADPWAGAPSPRALFTQALLLAAIGFLAGRFALQPFGVRIALTPGPTKARRVRRRALMLARLGTEGRTRAATGVLLYLSLAERRAEIVADAAIHARVTAETWGEAMAALLPAVREGRAGDGMAAAVERIGAVLAEHFPRSEDDVNELPDRVILL